MASPENLPPVENSLPRVKVYRLNKDGKWVDQGTGHVTIDYLEEGSDDMGLIVIDEEDKKKILVHRISSDDIYRKQEDTIISWRDTDFASELALSFQENTGCSSIWDSICSVKRTMDFSSLSNEAFHSANSKLRVFPAAELSALPLLLKTLVKNDISDRLRVTELILNDKVILEECNRVLIGFTYVSLALDKYHQFFLNQKNSIDFFRKLMNLFRICEDLDNIDGLHMIYKILRGIILLNSPRIFEKIFEDEIFMDIIGSLEYEPDVPRVHHRAFLKEHVASKEAIPITNPLVLLKIHQTCRVVYLKDVILPRVLDDNTIVTLNTIIHSNNAMVISFLIDDSIFIQELFARLKSSTTSAESKKKLVSFLQELCNLSKSLPMAQQLRFLRDLVNEGVFDILTDVLQSHDKKLVLTGTDILIFLNKDPNLLRIYVTGQKGVSLLGLLVKGMLTDFGDDMHCQFLESLRSLLDSNTLVQDAIIKNFYEKHFGEIIEVITSSCSTTGAMQGTAKSASSSGGFANQSSVKPEILINICELLHFCVLHHPYRIKCNFLLNGAVDKVLLLTRRKEKYLVAAAVRFVRALISSKDEHLMNHIVKNNTLKPIIDAFVLNGTRYNMLHSAILELFEYIRKENLKTLLKYIVESYWDQLVKFETLPSIRAFKVRYEQPLENPGTKNGPLLLYTRRRIDERAPEKEEEDYFNKESDEEDSPSACPPHKPNISAASYLSPRYGRLVDYEDDEDDKEDYMTPPRKQGTTSNKEGELPDMISKRKLFDSNEEFVLHDNEDHSPSPTKKRLIGNSEEGEPVELERKKAKGEFSKISKLEDEKSPKRKPLLSNEEPEFLNRQRLFIKISKSKEDVFASLCSTLSQAVLSTPKTSGAHDNVFDNPVSGSNDGSQEANGDGASSRSCLESTQAPEDRQRGGEDSPLIPPKSSPDKDVNGSRQGLGTLYRSHAS